MATPTYATTSEKVILAQVRLELNLTDGTADNLLLRRYIKQALTELRTPLMFTRKEETLQVYEDKVQLPDNFVRFDKPGSIYISGMTNPETETQAGGINSFPVGGNNAFFSGDPSGANQPPTWFPFFQQVGNTLYFSPGSSVEEIKISYTAVNTDEEGNWIIPANYERAISAYSKWKYAQTFSREFNADIRGEYFTEWRNSKRYLKGLENLQNDSDRQLTAIIMNRII